MAARIVSMRPNVALLLLIEDSIRIRLIYYRPEPITFHSPEGSDIAPPLEDLVFVFEWWYFEFVTLICPILWGLNRELAALIRIGRTSHGWPLPEWAERKAGYGKDSSRRVPSRR